MLVGENGRHYLPAFTSSSTKRTYFLGNRLMQRIRAFYQRRNRTVCHFGRWWCRCAVIEKRLNAHDVVSASVTGSLPSNISYMLS